MGKQEKDEVEKRNEIGVGDGFYTTSLPSPARTMSSLALWAFIVHC